MKSKFWVFLTLIIIAATVLASCQPAAKPPAAVPPTQVAAAAETNTPEAASATQPAASPTPTEWVPMKVAAGQTKVLIFVGFGTGTDPTQIAAHKKLQDEYNSTHKDIQIEFVTVSHDERQTKFATMLAGGMSPDIVMPIGVGGIAEFYDEWSDITPYIVKDKYDLTRFIGKTTEIHKYPDKGTLGLPMCVYPSVLYYNKDIFDAAGVEYPPHKFGANYADGSPWNYDKLVEIAKKMSLDTNGNDANSPAFDPKKMKQWGWDGFDWDNFGDWAQKWGPDNGTAVSRDGKKSLLASKTYIDAMNWTKDTMFTWHIRADSEQSGAFYDKSGDPFGSGMVGMWEIQSWMKYAYDSWDKAFSWDVAAIPTVQGQKLNSATDADTFVIPKSSKHKDQAWEVIKWFFEKKQLKTLTDIYGCIPADKDLAAQWKTELAAKYPNIDVQVFIDALEYTDTPNHEAWKPAYSKINDVIAKAEQEIYTGKNLDVNAVLSATDKEVQALLDDYWKNK